MPHSLGPAALLWTLLACACASPQRPSGDEGARFRALRDATFEAWLKDDPALGRSLGLHAFDGLVPDDSEAGVRARVTRAEAAATALRAIDPARLNPDDALDHALLLGEVEQFLFWMNDLDAWHTRPSWYGDLFTVDAYVTRDYAPVEERARRLLAHEKAALQQVPHLRQNLRGPLPKPFVETAIGIYAGYAEYLRGDVTTLLKGVGSPEFQVDFATANEALAKEADAFSRWLKDDALPRSDDGWVLGEARFRKLLLVQEGLSTPLDALQKEADEDLARNALAWNAVAPLAHPVKPGADEILPVATRQVAEARAFLVERNLLTLPPGDDATVRLAPPYQRWNFAFLDAPGPFETVATNAFYFVNKPDPAWTKEEQEGYLQPEGVLRTTSVHEVYPGHFLQGLWARRAPTRVQQAFGAYSFVEGWAHYAEQLMVEEGFGGGTPETRLGQISDALLRNCRYVASIGLHTRGMSLAEATRRFAEDCHQDPATAREQAVRGTFDPGYFAYTLGKLQILALRAEVKAKLGDRFSLRAFHDALLSHGSPAVPRLRTRVLHELGAD